MLLLLTVTASYWVISTARFECVGFALSRVGFSLSFEVSWSLYSLQDQLRNDPRGSAISRQAGTAMTGAVHLFWFQFPYKICLYCKRTTIYAEALRDLHRFDLKQNYVVFLGCVSCQRKFYEQRLYLLVNNFMIQYLILIHPIPCKHF